MKLEIQIAGRSRTVELERVTEGWRAKLDGSEVTADLIEITPGTFSILLDGRCFEVRIQALQGSGTLRIQSGSEEFAAEIIDPRAWRGRRGGLVEAEGRQQVLAPMPGKVVHVLVKAGDKVQRNQGLLVVEAMKMQNEIRSPKTGMVERLLVSEGQRVDAGDVLAIVG
ncbi:MAG TPA: biotin/lipoyl-containing protein [Candidatus Dormibacteraeota bacterium]|nr:biotin/lipoyl-containing protein [Candidatus Dormibacteraeota bacterium]